MELRYYLLANIRKFFLLVFLFLFSCNRSFKNEEVVDCPTISDPNMAYFMVSDVYLKDNMLYLLYYTPDNLRDKSKSKYLGILVFDISDDVVYKKRFVFEDNIIRICVTDNYIYGVLASGDVLKRYKINE